MGPNLLLVVDVVTRKAMLARIWNPDCEQDTELKQDLKRYVLQNLSRREMLDFLSQDYAQYAWSLGTLRRRLAYFDIKYVEYNTDLKEVEAAMQSELEGVREQDGGVVGGSLPAPHNFTCHLSVFQLYVSRLA